MRPREGVLWAVGWVALFALGLTTFWQYDDSTAAQKLGASLGRVVGALLIATLLRWLYLRFVKRRRRDAVRTPALMLVACLVAAVYVGVGEVRHGGGGACSDDARTAEELADGLPPDLLTRPAPSDVLGEFRKVMLRAVGEEGLRRLTGRQVLRDGEPVAIVVVIAVDERMEPGDVVRGAEEGAGASAKPAPLGNDESGGWIIESPDVTAVVGTSDDCAAVMVFAAEAADARGVAASLDV